MPATYISMLRGINVSGQKKIRMAELQAAYEARGLRDVRTYVQSGNVVFAAPRRKAGELVALLESQVEETFGFHVPVVLREAKAFRRIIEGNPFLDEGADAGKLHVTFPAERPSPAALRQLAAPANVADRFAPGRDAIYLFCPNGYGRTKLNNNFFEKCLGVACTTRNWKTVLALDRLAGD